MSTTKLAALRELEDELRQIRADYELAIDGEVSQQDDPWTPATLSLLAVVKFMKQMPGWNGLHFGLHMLLDALREIDEGRIPAWLSNSRVGRPPVPSKYSSLRAYCAGVMEFLMQNGRNRRQAADFVLNHLPSHVAQKIAGPRMTWNSVAGWRDQLSGSQNPERDYEQRSYGTILALLAGQDGPIDDRATRTLKALASLAADQA